MKLAPLFAWIVIAATALLILASACSDGAENSSEPQRPLSIAPAPVAPTMVRAISTTTPRPTSTPIPEIDDVSGKLAIISNRNDQTTRQRFKFLLPNFVDVCPDISSLTRAGDHLVIAHNLLDEAGLSREEGLIDVSNNLYWIVASVDSFATSNDIPMPKCLELFAAYTALRYQAWSAEEAREGVVDIRIGIYSLGQ